MALAWVISFQLFQLKMLIYSVFFIPFYSLFFFGMLEWLFIKMGNRMWIKFVFLSRFLAIPMTRCQAFNKTVLWTLFKFKLPKQNETRKTKKKTKMTMKNANNNENKLKLPSNIHTIQLNFTIWFAFVSTINTFSTWAVQMEKES